MTTDLFSDLKRESIRQYYQQVTEVATAALNQRARDTARKPRAGSKLANWLRSLRPDQQRAVVTHWAPFAPEDPRFEGDIVLAVSTTPLEASWLDEIQLVDDQVHDQVQTALLNDSERWMQVMLADLFDPQTNTELMVDE